jgi:hypothetical protein
MSKFIPIPPRDHHSAPPFAARHDRARGRDRQRRQDHADRFPLGIKEGISGMQQASAASSIRFQLVVAHAVAIKTIANTEATGVRRQKICMVQRQCRQKSSIQAMTIAALPIIV